MDPLKSQNCIITLLARGTFFNFLVLGDDMFPLHAFMFAYRFMVVNPCFVIFDNSLHENLSMTLLQKLHTCLYTCLFVLM